MVLTRPDFRLDTPNKLSHVTDAEWWMWLRLNELEPTTKLGGIYANKSGFHNTGNANEKNWPGNYSIRIDRNRRGPWWRNYASALDWTFPDAQRGDYKRISKYTSRLMKSALDANDPRLDMILYEFYGQSDTDKQVEGYNEYYEEHATSDQSHLWHIHMSFFRDACGDFWAMWALLTVLMGWTVPQWRDSLAGTDAPQPPPSATTPVDDNWTEALFMSLPILKQGSHGSQVRTVQALLLKHNSPIALQDGLRFIDGIFGKKTDEAVRRFQAAYKLTVDGIVGRKTWTVLVSK